MISAIYLIPSYRIIILLSFSPTRLIIECLKKPINDRRQVLLTWNKKLFQIEILIAIILMLITFSPLNELIPKCINYLFLYFSLSRCNEITYAFLQDVNEKINLNPSTTSLSGGERIKMAMRSYIGLLINFAVICYFLPQLLQECLYSPHFENFFDALYFSGITLTSFGYGDTKPTHLLSKLFVLYEVLAGLLLIVVALAVYLTIIHAQKKFGPKKTRMKRRLLNPCSRFRNHSSRRVMSHLSRKYSIQQQYVPPLVCRNRDNTGRHQNYKNRWSSK